MQWHMVPRSTPQAATTARTQARPGSTNHAATKAARRPGAPKGVPSHQRCGRRNRQGSPLPEIIARRQPEEHPPAAYDLDQLPPPPPPLGKPPPLESPLMLPARRPSAERSPSPMPAK
mmetsp:Transcript_122460/g.391840  ORF Transcript_122460/g.391840 Transcript_122460/m.391840 type:complete len:118 (-) Transcript_122460:631-984(-)